MTLPARTAIAVTFRICIRGLSPEIQSLVPIYPSHPSLELTIDAWSDLEMREVMVYEIKGKPRCTTMGLRRADPPKKTQDHISSFKPPRHKKRAVCPASSIVLAHFAATSAPSRLSFFAGDRGYQDHRFEPSLRCLVCGAVNHCSYSPSLLGRARGNPHARGKNIPRFEYPI